MLKRTTATLLLIASMLLTTWPAAHVSAHVPLTKPTVVSQAAAIAPAAISTVYLPVVTKGFGVPAVTIVSPFEGGSVSGTTYFAAQPADPGVTQVTFRAGSVNLGTDSTPADGFKVFLNARSLPAGPVTLTATASGPGGTTDTAITVNAVPNPPASSTVSAQGAVLASEIGSVITLPPGGAPSGTTISVAERSQQQVTSATDINWDALGVTFLGAQQVQASAAISQPLGVASAGFGSRVQPEQAVVNYQILPDADGDGVGELVAVNTASVAPTNDVISDPVPQIAIQHIQAQTAATIDTPPAPGSVLNSPTGTLIRIQGNGFNPASANGNVVEFRSLVDGEIITVPGIASLDTSDASIQIVTAIIPPLAAGAATMRVINQSTASATVPIKITIAPVGGLSATPAAIIDPFLSKSIQFLTSLKPAEAGSKNYQDQAIKALTDVQQLLPQAIADSRPVAQQALADFATTIQNSGIIARFPIQFQDVTPQILSAQETSLLNDIATIYAGMGTLGGIGVFRGGGAAAFPVLAPIDQGIATAAGILKIYEITERRLNPCSPNLIAQTTSTLIGMGSAPVPGGNSCGSANSSDVQASGVVSLTPGRYTINIFAQDDNRRLTPFTGASDAGGYFFLPLIPQGIPFHAVAIDSATGATQTFDGVGPAPGSSAVMFFDFANAESKTDTLNIGDTVSNGVPAAGAGNIETPGSLDLYTFNATAGQQVFFQELTGDCLSKLKWKLIGPDRSELFNQTLGGTGCGQDAGLYTMTQTGAYTLQVSGDVAGTYSFKLWNVPAPQEFTTALGNTVSNGVPSAGAGNIETPGVKDIYTFTATAGQQVYFQELTGDCLSDLAWRLTDASNAEIFNKPFGGTGCGQEAASRTLTLGGTYTLVVAGRTGGIGANAGGGTGTYSFKLWNIPAPQQFTTAIGNTISNGVPSAGAGNIETPGVKDIYTFTATVGQQVYFQELTGDCLSDLAWRLTDASNAEIFNKTFGGTGCGQEAASRTLTLGGTYTLVVAGRTGGIGANAGGGTGTYSFKLWNIPAPQQFTTAIGNTISNGVPSAGAGNIETPGVKDIYTFTATAGQQVYFDELTGDCLSHLAWRVMTPSGAELFNDTLGGTGCGQDVGLRTLTESGTYTLTVAGRTNGIGADAGSGTGAYSFKLTPQ